MEKFSLLENLIAIAVVIVSGSIIAIRGFIDYKGLKSRDKKNEELQQSFDTIVERLSSESKTSQLSAAILLRRFMSIESIHSKHFKIETINVISSLLRSLPTGVLQKSLADGLVYGKNISGVDLQYTNLQNVYFGAKDFKFLLQKADLFNSNLSYALIDNVDAQGVILYNAILHRCKIKNSDFSYADFRGADLSGTRFINTILTNANFETAHNIPEEIKKNLTDGIYTSSSPVTTDKEEDKKLIFFSMPGSMNPTDRALIDSYRCALIDFGYEVLYYQRDQYPEFGQISKVKADILRSDAMIAFGTKQLFIQKGILHPNMTEEKELHETWYSTPWNELEVGMAMMANIPVLLVKDEALNYGIFDEILSDYSLDTIKCHGNCFDLQRDPNLIKWLSKISH
jgi:uncharacterized protein YjbI with pentapeptide repeats